MATKNETTCFIHTGRSRSLCARHKRAVRELAAKGNISEEAAAFELRAFEIEVADARRKRASELETAIRTIREHRALVASRRSTSKRKRDRG